MALNTYHYVLERALKTELIQPPELAQDQFSPFINPFLIATTWPLASEL